MVDVSSGRTYCSVLRNRGDSILALESRQSPSGAKIARTLELSADGHLAVLDYQVGADCSKPSTIRVEITRDQGQHAAALDSTGNRLAVLRRNAENARVEFIDLLAPERHQSVSIMAGAKWFVLSSDGQWLASCDLQSELVVTNVATAANISTGIHCPNEVGGRGLQAPVAFGSTVLGAWMWEREFTMFDLFSKESHTIKVPTPRLVAAGLLAFSLSDDGKLFLASDNYGVSVWDVAASHMLTQNLFGLRNLNSRSEPLMPPAVAFSADGRLAAGQDRAEHLQVWRWSESWIMGQLHHLFKEPD